MPGMTVAEALAKRRSVRAYLDRAVDPALIARLLAGASRAPSGGNLQPWQVDVLTGRSLAALKALMADRVAADPKGEPVDYAIYPPGLADPHDARRRAIGEAMYAALDIPRDDRAARRRWFAGNFAFFGAPAGLFLHVDRGMGPPQWSDLGMFLQSLMLLATEAGLATCAQECWAMFPHTLAGFLGTPDRLMLFCGLAIGYEDVRHPVAALTSPRAPLAEFATFHD